MIKETNIPKTRKIIDALLVLLKLPEVLKGKNSAQKIKKYGSVVLSRWSKLKLNDFLALLKVSRNNLNTKNKIVTKPNIPNSLRISK